MRFPVPAPAHTVWIQGWSAAFQVSYAARRSDGGAVQRVWRGAAQPQIASWSLRPACSGHNECGGAKLHSARAYKTSPVRLLPLGVSLTHCQACSSDRLTRTIHNLRLPHGARLHCSKCAAEALCRWPQQSIAAAASRAPAGRKRRRLTPPDHAIASGFRSCSTHPQAASPSHYHPRRVYHPQALATPSCIKP